MKHRNEYGRVRTATAIGALLVAGIMTNMSSQAFAQDDASEMLDDVVVTATKTPTRIKDIPASVTVITAQDIEEQGAVSIAELLRRTPGINFNTSGGIGKYTRVQMRGLDESHTLIMIDGVRQNNPSDYSRTADLDSLTVHNIEKIEIVRGPQATLYGSNASGGVINIITKRGSQDGFHGGVKAEYGSYATRRLDGNISYGGKIGEMPFSLSYAHSEYLANGPSVASDEYVKPTGTSVPSEDDRTIIYKHSLKATFDPTEDIRGQIFFSVSDLSSDLDGSNSSYLPIDLDKHKDKREYSYGAAVEVDTLEDRLVHKLQVSGTMSRTDYFDRDSSKASKYTAYKGHYIDSHGDTLQVDYSGAYKFNQDHTLTIGGSWDMERYERNAAIDNSPTATWQQTNEHNQFHTSAFTQLQSAFLNDALHINLGVSYDMFSANVDNKLTYRGGVSYVVPQYDTLLKTSYGTGFMAPSLYRLHRYAGQPTLKPEESTLFEAGFEQPLFDRRLNIGATVFKNKVKNQLAYVKDPALCGGAPKCYINRDEMNSKGVEAEVNALAYQGDSDSLELGATYTFTYAEDEDGLEIDRVPRNNLGLNAAYRFDDEKGLLRLDGQYNGRRKDYYNFGSGKTEVRDGGEWMLGFTALYEFYDGVTAYLRGENIFDANYTTSTGYAGTPQGFYAGIGYKF